MRSPKSTEELAWGLLAADRLWIFSEPPKPLLIVKAPKVGDHIAT